MPYSQRAEIVLACRYVDYVIPETCWEQKNDDIANYNINVLVMGNDWSGKFDNFLTMCDVIYLPRTESISTTHLKNVLNPFSAEVIAKLKESLDIINSIAINFEA